jgi:hypothetical protein
MTAEEAINTKGKIREAAAGSFLVILMLVTLLFV